MKRKIIIIMKEIRRAVYFLIILITVLASTASAQELREDKTKKHFLWSVKSGEGTVYLLGSIHILKKGSYPLPDAIEKAYGCCSKLVFETDLDGMNDPATQEKMARRGIYPHGQTLSKNVSPETYALLRKKVAAAGLQIEKFEQFRPWFAALTVTALHIQRLGYDPELGIDRYFYSRAKKDNKEMVFLETNEYQLNLIANMNRRQQELFLSETLKELGVIETMASDMIAAWNTGDAERLDSIISISFEGYHDIYNRFFVLRNKQWLPRIEQLLRQGGEALIIVGTGHLVGKQSLIELLSEKGYQIEQR